MPTVLVSESRVLIVDDQEPNVALLETILRRAGFRNLRSVMDSRLVVPTFSEFQPDIVLLDLMMPHMDGFQVMDKLSALLSPDDFRPILMLTADLNTDTRMRALALGAKDFLTKPFDPTEVLLRVRNLLHTRVLYVAEQERKRQVDEQNMQIQEVNARKSAFLAAMSHEIRTPLNAILGFTQLVVEGKADPTEQREFLTDVVNSSRHLLALVNDVLDLAKVEAGKVEFHPEPVDMPALVTEVVGSLRPLADPKRLTIETGIAPGIKEVVIDRARLKQVLYNYLSNAIKFTPEAGRVAVRVLPDGSGHFRLEVEDSGAGIAPDEMDQLFVEFHQLKRKGGQATGGTGLGLALAKRLVEAQGGTVGVQSRPGEGSVFHAILPVSPRRSG